MAVSIHDLPPAYQAQALMKYMEQQRGIDSPAALQSEKKKSSSKYHNQPAERVAPSGKTIRFDSAKEARRYDELIALERAGQIRDLRLQVDFTLQEAYTDSNGSRVRAIRYRADFTYSRPKENPCEHCPSGAYRGCDGCGYTRPPKEWKGIPWELLVEDVKSLPTRTKEYLIKRKLMKERYGIDIVEI